MKHFDLGCNYDKVYECRKWSNTIPALKFPSNWEITIVPPFGGATVRFKAKLNNNIVSVYLDCYDNLGSVGEPYWEIYDGNETYRFLINDTENLLNQITLILEREI